MSLEIQKRVLLSEWRVVMVSQTSYPTMYTLDRPAQHATVKIPLGSRIITKWQEQVRPIESENEQWYVVREWTEADM